MGLKTRRKKVSQVSRDHGNSEGAGEIRRIGWEKLFTDRRRTTRRWTKLGFTQEWQEGRSYLLSPMSFLSYNELPEVKEVGQKA
ncbi:hypothetical protein KOW79_015166 [Hemibagrus wyckioides]|uniref:Uncharacterized protein n=1 Tax=Hemibagrus wyckioides TaxID=337641 RepID=A0A9D3SDU8_9TELE|nr:hypothetical protein KOW79_015166 [Hemibagrus wyckioides]